MAFNRPAGFDTDATGRPALIRNVTSNTTASRDGAARRTPGTGWHHALGSILFCLLAVIKMPPPAHADEAIRQDNMAVSERQPGAGTVDNETPPHFHPGKYNLHLFPPGDFYRPYAADPHRTGFGIQKLNVIEGKIPAAGSSRYALKAGGYFGVLRVQPEDDVETGVQLNIGGGLGGQFDLDHFQDNIGWNGHYGMILTAAPTAAVALKLGLQHVSGHIGDENVLSSQRGRIGYTRMELNAGGSWKINRQWRTYAEAGRGYELLNREFQKPGRVQYGLEYEYLFWRNLGCYAAFDSSAMEERAWRFDKTLQLGLVSHTGHRSWRFGFEISKGRPTMVEFFPYTETYTSIGLWLDL